MEDIEAPADITPEKIQDLEDEFVDDPEGFNDDVDEGRQLHDEYIISKTTTAGLCYAVEVLGLTISDSMKACARGVISKVNTGASTNCNGEQLKIPNP